MFCFVEESIYFCGMKTYMKEISDIELIDIILNGGEQADKAMYDLLHHRLHHQLKDRFEVYLYQLYNHIKFSNRPFNNVEQINETLINNWNRVVRKDDTILTSTMIYLIILFIIVARVCATPSISGLSFSCWRVL